MKDSFCRDKNSKWDKKRTAIQAAKTGRAGNVEYITVAQEGFCGLYHVPVKDHDPKKAVIVIGGSEGGKLYPMSRTNN